MPMNMYGLSQSYGIRFWGTLKSGQNKDNSTLGSILGSPYFGKLPWHIYIYMYIYIHILGGFPHPVIVV